MVYVKDDKLARVIFDKLVDVRYNVRNGLAGRTAQKPLACSSSDMDSPKSTL